MICEGCGKSEGVELEDSRTMYAPPVLNYWDRVLLDGEEPPDPNAPIPLCRDCAVEHHANWDERWADYYSGLL